MPAAGARGSFPGGEGKFALGGARCGSAGIYNITQPEMSAKLLARKMACIAQTGADVVAVVNPGCEAQLEVGVRATGTRIKILHPVTLLVRASRQAASSYM